MLLPAEWHCQCSKCNCGHAKDTSKDLGRNVRTSHANNCWVFEALDVFTSRVITVGGVSTQSFLTLASGWIQIGAYLKDGIGIFLIPVVLVLYIAGFFARGASWSNQWLLCIGKGFPVVKGLVDSSGSGVTAGLFDENTKKDLLSVSRAVYIMEWLQAKLAQVSMIW